MRESVFFEVSLRRFDVWQAAVAAVAGAAIATSVAWAASTFASQSPSGARVVVAVAALLVLATLALARSLVGIGPGVLAGRDGVWSYAPERGAVRAGSLTVALDLGSFLLLRVGAGRAVVWLPVQRRGLERQWHALRCAVYAPMPSAAGSPAPPRLDAR
jgi:hypothetical protein